jgi:tetratricopeptide (TPR) repeat protein
MRTYLSRALAYIGEQGHRVAMGVNDCNTAIELAAENPRAFRLRAIAHGLLKNYEATIADCTRALELAPEDVIAYVQRAEAHLEKHNDDQTIADATAAIGLESEQAMAYALRGIAYANKGQQDRAASDLDKASRLDKQFAELKSAYARELAQERQQPPIARNPQFQPFPTIPSRPNVDGRMEFRLPKAQQFATWGIFAAIGVVGTIIAGLYKGIRERQ